MRTYISNRDWQKWRQNQSIYVCMYVHSCTLPRPNLTALLLLPRERESPRCSQVRFRRHTRRRRPQQRCMGWATPLCAYFSYTHTFLHSHSCSSDMRELSEIICELIYLHTYIHTYILTYIFTYIHTHTYIHCMYLYLLSRVEMYVGMKVCMCSILYARTKMYVLYVKKC